MVIDLVDRATGEQLMRYLGSQCPRIGETICKAKDCHYYKVVTVNYLIKDPADGWLKNDHVELVTLGVERGMKDE